jgi:hypothetical protein
MIVTRRSRILLYGAALSPTAIVVFKLNKSDAVREAEVQGAHLLSFEPGFLILGLFFIGLVCALAAIASIIVDIRRAG